MVNIEMLQAAHGDAFILHCQKGSEKGVVVVDGGPSCTSCDIVDKLDTLDSIDLLILSHYDDDHIEGILEYIISHKNDRPFPVKEMWLNCAYDIALNTTTNISFGNAKKLADVLSEINSALVEQNYSPISWEKPIIASNSVISLPFADFVILSPDAYTKVLNDMNYKGTLSANIARNYSRQNMAYNTSLGELANAKKDKTPSSVQAIVNKSSIAFLMTCDHFSALMLGDCYPSTIVASLTELGYSPENQLKVDYVKIAHHGSRHNTSNDMLDLIDCNRYLISTNGGSGVSCHPDRETIANIACHPKRNAQIPVELYFNHDISLVEANGYSFLREEDYTNYNICIYDDVQELSK